MIHVLFWLCALSLTAICAAPVWSRVLHRGEYWYLPLAAAAFAILLAVRVKSCKLPSDIFTWLLFAVGVVLQVVSIRQTSPWLAALGWCLITVLCLSCCQSREKLSNPFHFLSAVCGPTLGLVSLVVMLLPIPRNYDQAILSKAQEYSSQLISYCLDLLSIPNTFTAHDVQLPGAEFPISALQPVGFSPLAIAFALILIQVLRNRSLWMTPCYFAAGIFISILMNCSLSLVLIVAKLHYGTDLLAGWPALLTYSVVVLMAFLIALSMDRLLNETFSATRPDELNEWNNPLISLWNRMFSPGGTN